MLPEVVALTFLGGTRGSAGDLRSLFHIHISLVLFVFLFFVVVPVVQILRRTGHNPVWCLLALVPGLNFLAFWFLAFKPWPTEKKSGN
jgi:hypothetical protein